MWMLKYYFLKFLISFCQQRVENTISCTVSTQLRSCSTKAKKKMSATKWSRKTFLVKRWSEAESFTIKVNHDYIH